MLLLAYAEQVPRELHPCVVTVLTAFGDQVTPDHDREVRLAQLEPGAGDLEQDLASLVRVLLEFSLQLAEMRLHLVSCQYKLVRHETTLISCPSGSSEQCRRFASPPGPPTSCARRRQRRRTARCLKSRGPGALLRCLVWKGPRGGGLGVLGRVVTWRWPM